MAATSVLAAAPALSQEPVPLGVLQGGVPTGQATPAEIALSLTEAIERGLRYNLGAILGDAAVIGAEGARKEALADLLPQLRGGGRGVAAEHQPRRVRLHRARHPPARRPVQPLRRPGLPPPDDPRPEGAQSLPRLRRHARGRSPGRARRPRPRGPRLRAGLPAGGRRREPHRCRARPARHGGGPARRSPGSQGRGPRGRDRGAAGPGPGAVAAPAAHRGGAGRGQGEAGPRPRHRPSAGATLPARRPHAHRARPSR